ncbi:unnamed protein product [Lupinus luteus]|uniref:Bulb-type lectin domain-containing protein n=1 Tax=Lupinus luteus TaxID=3873 RepID=A0AAV1VVR5_LUPLU
MDEQNQVLWTTNVSNIAASNSTTAQLQNSGNLVLQENTSGSMLWQSLQHPCDTLLQQMKLTLNKTNGEKTELTSWRSPQDPSIGEFSASLDRLSIPEVFVWRGEQQYWRSGPWNGQIFLGTPGMNTAWKMWNDGNITSLIDPQISNPIFHTDILRCIHIGLLCVQEHAIDRPTMTKVISMLNSETLNLPPPKQPAFIQRQVMLDVESSHISDRLFSINYVSLTRVQAR